MLNGFLHLFQVEEIEGRTLAVQSNCQFHEVSVAENSPSIYSAIDNILNECRSVQSTQKTRKFSVSKMIGTLIGSTNGKVTPNTNQGGTVVVCHKSDLYKSRVLKRRQNFTATASLWLSENTEQDGNARWISFGLSRKESALLFLSFMGVIGYANRSQVQRKTRTCNNFIFKVGKRHIINACGDCTYLVRIVYIHRWVIIGNVWIMFG